MDAAERDDHHLAARLAAEAGEVLVQLRHQLDSEGAPHWRVMDEGDLVAHRFLVERLHQLRPGDAVLSEEGRDHPSRLRSDRVWIVDPLDGTNEYGEGRADFAVHVALVSGGFPVAAAVALPALGSTFATAPPPDPPPPLDGRRRLRIVTSRFRSTYHTALVAESLAAEVVRIGSAGAKTMAVVTGEADVYVHAGGMYEWDSAAPAAVARAAGLHVSRIDGSPLVYNRPDPWLPDLLVCRPELAGPILEVLR